MRFFQYLFFLCLVFSWQTQELTAQNEERDWTLLVYIVGSDLESGSDAATTDIAEMIAGAGVTDYVNVLLMTGGSNKPGWNTIRTFSIENGQQTELSFQPSNNDMSDPNNLVEFINWGTSNYPAQSYMLTMWNHGGELRGFGWVDGTEDHLSVNQIQQAIGQTTFISGGNKFDVIGFDACLMANLEVQSMLADYGFYFVGSEETEPGHGWNWTPIIEAMEGGEALFGDQLGTIIVDSYKQHARDEGTNNTGVTLSVTDLGQISNLESNLQSLLTKIQNENREASLQQAVSASEEYGKAAQYPSTSSDVVDLGDLMDNLKQVAPSLTTEVDLVLNALNQTVVHHINDNARPKASGMSAYFPHNVFSSEGELEYVVTDVYTPLNISAYLKDFILNDYIPYVTSDQTVTNSFTTSSYRYTSSLQGGNADEIGNTLVSLTIDHNSDIEHVQVVLDEEFSGNPNEFILLGSTLPDSIGRLDEDTDVYYYNWDEKWLGLNGHPAYISDIHDYVALDEEGTPTTFHRIHIPAVLNSGTPDKKNIMITYRFDDEFNYVLESIIHEHNGSSETRLVPKERIFLQPGDQIQLLYEVFNEVSDEEFFYEKPGATIDITNGNEDLRLEHDQLEPGVYQIGFVILDHSHNDTIIFVDDVFEISPNSTVENFRNYNISMFPNPANQEFTLSFPDQSLIGLTAKVSIVDRAGRIIVTYPLQNGQRINTQNIPSGSYQVLISSEGRLFTDQLIIQH